MRSIEKIVAFASVLLLSGFQCDGSTFERQTLAVYDGYLQIRGAESFLIYYCTDDYPDGVSLLWIDEDELPHSESVNVEDGILQVSRPGAITLSVEVNTFDCFREQAGASLSVSWCGSAGCAPLHVLQYLDWPFTGEYPAVVLGSVRRMQK